MSVGTEGATESACFHHQQPTGGDCECPIHAGGSPVTAPLGQRFADAVSVSEIDREAAEAIYQSHHSYMPSVPTVNLAHHAIEYQGYTTGAITYRYPLMRCKKIHLRADGTPIPEPMSADRIRRKLPEELHYTALNVLELDRSAEGEPAETRIVEGDKIVEAARVCIGVDMANLASCGLAASQRRFAQSEHADDVEYLLTFVRGDYDATMLRALRDKGWRCVGWTRPSQAGNREQKDIRDQHKWCFLCSVDAIVEQQSLAAF